MELSKKEAIEALKKGEVVALPTETVYGLAASIYHLEGIEKIFALKGRPLQNPLIIHSSCLSMISDFIQTPLPPQFDELANHFWPGPLTLVLPVKEEMVPPLVRASLASCGFRVPLLPLTREIIEETGPLVMPSANLSGRPSATSPEAIVEDFGASFPFVNGGNSKKGVESTILIFYEAEWKIGRLGAISPEELMPFLGYLPQIIEKKEGSAPLCPGHSYRHYAPKAHLLFNETAYSTKASFILGFKERKYPQDKTVLELGSLENPYEVAQNLYASLRKLDALGAKSAWVDMDFPKEGLWQTIDERLKRAGE